MTSKLKTLFSIDLLHHFRFVIVNNIESIV